VGKLKRIHIHWTAGAHAPNATDRKHYHYIVSGEGEIVSGDLPPEANITTSTPYVAHTRGANTGAIGVAFAAMHNAKQEPFRAGGYPITEAQVKAMTELCADLCMTYDIPVERNKVLTHAEVMPTLGIWQRGKWDVTWLPGLVKPQPPLEVGDILRSKILEKLQASSGDSGGWRSWLRGIFK